MDRAAEKTLAISSGWSIGAVPLRERLIPMSFAYNQCICDRERKLSNVRRAIGTSSTAGIIRCRYLVHHMGHGSV